MRNLLVLDTNVQLAEPSSMLEQPGLTMFERLKKNWKKAVTEVGISVLGSVGLVYALSFVLSLDSEKKRAWEVFASYFDGGELGLSILSLSGVIYILLMKHRASHEKPGDKDGQGFISYIVFFAPVVIAAFIVGSNPGFEPEKMGVQKLQFLVFLYVLIHIVWLVSLLRQPVLETPEETNIKESKNVNDILKKAAGHGK